MRYVPRLTIGARKGVPLVLQGESSECGLACLAMVASYHGHHLDLAFLRRRFPISLKGLSLSQLMQLATRFKLESRPLKLDLEGLAHLRLPCILHWDFKHFVVLTEYSKTGVVIHDPAIGTRRLDFAALSRSFTGVALELWPSGSFQDRSPEPAVRLRDLLSGFKGIKVSLAQILVLAAGMELISLLMPFYIQLVLDKGVFSGDQHFVSLLAICFLVLVAVHHGIAAVRSWMIVHLSTTLNMRWKNGVLSHLMGLPVEFFQKRHLGDIISRVGSVDVIQRTLTTTFLEALLDGIMVVAIFVMMLLYSTSLALISLGGVSMYIVIKFVMYTHTRAATAEQLIHSAKQTTHFLETIRGIKAVQLFGKREDRRATWMMYFVDQLNAGARLERLRLLQRLANGWIYGLEKVVSIWLAALFVMDHRLSAGAMIAYVAYREQFTARTATLVDSLFELKMLRLQGERLADVMLAKQDDGDDDRVCRDLGELASSIQMEGVGFRYSRFDTTVLKAINMHIHPGESIAIIGPSGCGKTTLMSLLTGALAPSQGVIRVGGIDIKDIGRQGYQQIIGVVSQEDVLFAGSIAENISFFSERPSWEDIEASAKIADIHNDIMKLPMGYETLVGDMGSALSGGQKQRILLARSLYKKPKILLLDEATSNLDSDCERRVSDAIKALSITKIFIAHRPETISSADRIYKLQDGCIFDLAEENQQHAQIVGAFKQA